MKKPRRDVELELSELRVTLAEELAYRERLPAGLQADTVDRKIAYWRRRISELEAQA
jgi:hypothetical protein